MMGIFCKKPKNKIKINLNRAIITSAWLKKQDHSPAKDFFPKDGTDPSNEWLGLIDPMEKPYIIDPPKGYIFQANNKFASDGYKY